MPGMRILTNSEKTRIARGGNIQIYLSYYTLLSLKIFLLFPLNYPFKVWWNSYWLTTLWTAQSVTREVNATSRIFPCNTATTLAVTTSTNDRWKTRISGQLWTRSWTDASIAPDASDSPGRWQAFRCWVKRAGADRVRLALMSTRWLIVSCQVNNCFLVMIW